MDGGANLSSRVKGVLGKRKLKADYQRTFGSPHGQRVLHHLMQENGVLSTTVAVNGHKGIDSHATMVNEGRRYAVLAILQMTQFTERDLRSFVEGDEGDDVDS